MPMLIHYESVTHPQEVTENTWKLRLPNEWEPIRWWSDLLTWRCQVHNSTINMFKQVEVSRGLVVPLVIHA